MLKYIKVFGMSVVSSGITFIPNLMSVSYLYPMLDTHTDSVVMSYSYFLSWGGGGGKEKWANKSSCSNIRIFQASAAVHLCPCSSGMLHNIGWWLVTDAVRPLKMGPTGCPKSLVTNHQQVQCNIPEEWQPEYLITWSKISKAESVSCCERFI